MEDQLNELADLTKRPKSFYVKEALEMYLSQMEDKIRATAYPGTPTTNTGGDQPKTKKPT